MCCGSDVHNAPSVAVLGYSAMNVIAVAFAAWNSTNAPMITTVAVRLPDGRACEERRDGQVLDRFSVEVGEVVEHKINVRGGGVVENLSRCG